MRWFWVDRFTEFVSGSHACGIKNVSLDEEVVDEYCPGFPLLPPTLIIEGMAQMGGIMVAQYFDFDKRVVLAKVNKAIFHAPARTGDQLCYRVTLDRVQENGATVTCTSHCNGELASRNRPDVRLSRGRSFYRRIAFRTGGSGIHAANDELFPCGSRRQRKPSAKIRQSLVGLPIFGRQAIRSWQRFFGQVLADIYQSLLTTKRPLLMRRRVVVTGIGMVNPDGP